MNGNVRRSTHTHLYYTMKDPLSVIIPVYNRESLVIRTLDSVYAQSWRPIELIVVDNNSTDNSRSVVEDWARQHADQNFKINILEEKTPGACAARQTGFEAATSDVVAFFDSDDTMHPDLAKTAMQDFLRDPDLDIVCWRVSYGADTPGGQRPYKRFSQRNPLRRHLLNGMLSTQAYAVKADYFRRHGGWDPTLPIWNDWELGLRLLLGNPHISFHPETRATVYPQVQSITGQNHVSRIKQFEAALNKMRQVSLNQPEPLRSRLMSLLLYRSVNLAALYKREGNPEAAAELLRHSLETTDEPAWRKVLLRLIYAYTSLGGRCAYLLWH